MRVSSFSSPATTSAPCAQPGAHLPSYCSVPALWLSTFGQSTSTNMLLPRLAGSPDTSYPTRLNERAPPAPTLSPASQGAGLGVALAPAGGQQSIGAKSGGERGAAPPTSK
jgi:hypothetical protein